MKRPILAASIVLLGLVSCKLDSSSTSNGVGGASSSDDVLQNKPKEYLYASIPWGSDRLAVERGMNKQGFKFVRRNDEGDQIYEGKLAEESTTAFAAFTNDNRLVWLQLVVEPPENMFWQKYEVIKKAIIKKYGEPYKDDMQFDAPYKAGDGYEAQAIRQGKATFNSEWWTTYTLDPYDGGKLTAVPGIELYVKDKLLIYVTYHSKRWNVEYEKRYNKGTGGL